MQYILGPFWPKITQQIILSHFRDQDVKAWFRVYSGVASGPDFDFSGRFGIREHMVARLRFGEIDKPPKNAHGQMNS